MWIHLEYGGYYGLLCFLQRNVHILTLVPQNVTLVKHEVFADIIS